MDHKNIAKVIVKLGFEGPTGLPLSHEYSYEEFAKGIQIKQPDGVQLVFVSRYSDYRKFDVIVQIAESVTNKSVGNLLSVVFVYENLTKEYISTVIQSSKRAENTKMMIGDRSEDKTFEKITSEESWRGMPAIGSVSDYVTITMAEIEEDEPIPLPEEEPDPPPKPSESGPEEPKPPIIIEPEQIPESPTFRPEPPIEGKVGYLNKVRRNARYRGPRESDKEFLDNEEVRLDLEDFNEAIENIVSLSEMLMNNIEGEDNTIEIESDSNLIISIKRAIESVDAISAYEADEEVKKIRNGIQDIEERIDHYGKIVDSKT